MPGWVIWRRSWAALSKLWDFSLFWVWLWSCPDNLINLSSAFLLQKHTAIWTMPNSGHHCWPALLCSALLKHCVLIRKVPAVPAQLSPLAPRAVSPLHFPINVMHVLLRLVTFKLLNKLVTFSRNMYKVIGNWWCSSNYAWIASTMNITQITKFTLFFSV